jgi:hypothetical protein
MWVFTEVADWFDKVRHDNEKFLADGMRDTDDDFLGAMAWTGIGVVRLLNGVAGGVAGGFIDVLRIGDGVKEGGWGYGKDALRALAIVGPALKVGRMALGLVAAVDATPAVGNCAWVSAARAARMTGTQHFATVGQLASAIGIGVGDTAGMNMLEVQNIIRLVNGETTLVRGVLSFEEVAQLARNNPDGVVVFPVTFMRTAGQTVNGISQAAELSENGHALIAKAVGGTVFIVDRSGKVYRSLQELEGVYGAASGLPPGASGGLGMTVMANAGVVVVKNARVIGGIEFASAGAAVLNALAFEMRAVPNPFKTSNAPIYIKTGLENLYGWWWVTSGPYLWCYYFGADRKARWYDPNTHQNATGTWSEQAGNIEVKWPSGTVERWPTPLVPSNEEGEYTSGSKVSAFTARRVWDAQLQKLTGRWVQRCDKWTWNIDIAGNGKIRWSDAYNPAMNGAGVWHLMPDGLYAIWNSGSRDTWTINDSGALESVRNQIFEITG